MPSPNAVTAPAVPKTIAVPAAVLPTLLVPFECLLAVSALVRQNCSALEQFVATLRHLSKNRMSICHCFCGLA